MSESYSAYEPGTPEEDKKARTTAWLQMQRMQQQPGMVTEADLARYEPKNGASAWSQMSRSDGPAPKSHIDVRRKRDPNSPSGWSYSINQIMEE